LNRGVENDGKLINEYAYGYELLLIYP